MRALQPGLKAPATQCLILVQLVTLKVQNKPNRHPKKTVEESERERERENKKQRGRERGKERESERERERARDTCSGHAVTCPLASAADLELVICFVITRGCVTLGFRCCARSRSRFLAPPFRDSGCDGCAACGRSRDGYVRQNWGTPNKEWAMIGYSFLGFPEKTNPRVLAPQKPPKWLTMVQATCFLCKGLPACLLIEIRNLLDLSDDKLCRGPSFSCWFSTRESSDPRSNPCAASAKESIYFHSESPNPPAGVA